MVVPHHPVGGLDEATAVAGGLCGQSMMYDTLVPGGWDKACQVKVQSARLCDTNPCQTAETADGVRNYYYCDSIDNNNVHLDQKRDHLHGRHAQALQKSEDQVARALPHPIGCHQGGHQHGILDHMAQEEGPVMVQYMRPRVEEVQASAVQ